MAEPSQHNNYSFEEIQRYLQGKMNAAEMYAIEKAALQDPFLADAIEGFNDADFTTAQQHLNEINAGLFKEKARSKVVAFNKKTQWLNIAVLVIILAGIGLVATYFLRPSNNNQTEIAQVKKSDTNKAAPQNPGFEKLNIAPALSDTASFIAENKAAKKTQPTSLKRKAKEQVVAADNNALTDAEADTYKAAIASANAPVQEKVMMARSYNAAAYPSIKTVDSLQPDIALQGKVSGLTVLPAAFSGKVVDENNRPIAGVSIISADKKDAVLTDVNGSFKLLKIDSQVNVTVNTVGYVSKEIDLRQGFNNPIVLQQNNAALNDVVVTGYGTKRKKNVFETDSIIREQDKQLSDSAMPVGGWKNFSNYIITQLNKDTTTAPVTNSEDVVELEFLIDKTGTPYDITVTKSSDKQHNRKAVELLKNGPKWTKPSNKKKAKVVINF